MSRRNFTMARRRKKTRRFSFLFILVTLALSIALFYIFIIKGSLSDRATEDSPDLAIRAEDEALLELEKTGTKADMPLVPAGVTEVAPGNLEQGHSFDDIDPNTWGQELIVIKDGNDLLAPVNKKTTLKPDYEPEDLELIPEYMKPEMSMQLRKPALKMLIAMWYAAEFDGVHLKVVSAYRSYDYQKELFQRYSDNYGPEEANRFSARPGQSEHQLGTTVDFGGTAQDLTADFAETVQGLWLAENAHLFGFVMSYPEGGEDVTGYIYEPWHYRFIGIEEALHFKKSNLTLTEYLNQMYEW
jgi:LAS superfamily LD-carboxypeptidase LdcB